VQCGCWASSWYHLRAEALVISSQLHPSWLVAHRCCRAQLSCQRHRRPTSQSLGRQGGQRELQQIMHGLCLRSTGTLSNRDAVTLAEEASKNRSNINSSWFPRLGLVRPFLRTADGASPCTRSQRFKFAGYPCLLSQNLPGVVAVLQFLSTASGRCCVQIGILSACAKQSINPHSSPAHHQHQHQHDCTPKKRKEKTTLAVTATVSDSTAGISFEEAE